MRVSTSGGYSAVTTTNAASVSNLKLAHLLLPIGTQLVFQLTTEREVSLLASGRDGFVRPVRGGRDRCLQP